MAGFGVGKYVPIVSYVGQSRIVEPIVVASPTPAVNKPIRLVIEDLGIKSEVEHVGLTENKAMDVPKEKLNVAWYELGAKPGEVGSAVITGHFDWYDGPAVFFNLDKLEPGDEIEVVAREDEVLRFLVTEKTFYTNEDFPIDLVFARKDKKRLNLITCDGVFNRQTNEYDEKLVIFSELIE